MSKLRTTLSRIRRERPAAAGVAIGLGISGVLVFAVGVTNFAAAPLLPVLLWAAVMYGRPASEQAGALIVIGAAVDLLSGGILGVSIAAMGAGMVAAGLASRQSDRLLRADHALYAAAACAGWILLRVTGGMAMPAWFGEGPRAVQVLSGFALLLVVVGAIALVRILKPAPKQPRLARGRLAA